LSSIVEVRVPKYPECWETCGDCGSGDIVVQSLRVKPGDELKADDTILVLETGKIALDIPSPYSGRVVEISVAEGDALAEGQLILTLIPT
jgi:pyruvate/2-oxoglutarate dehydrogenase complex dihydrolipoamide acyltransferase (E2) component